MTDRPRRRYPGGPKGKRRQEELLSEAEVQRRITGEGGGQLQPPPPEHKFRDRRPTIAARRSPRRGAARDGLLLVGLAGAGLIATVALLPKGPAAANATAGPSLPGATAAALGSGAAPSSPPTGNLITLPPGAVTTPSAEPLPTEAVLGPTAASIPTPTARPRTTPRPTTKPGTTPVPATPKPTGTPVATEPPVTSATLVVYVDVVADDGGNDGPGAWTIHVASGGSASPASFAGSAAGVPVTITANESYSATSASGPGGYTSSRSAGCSSSTAGLPAPGSTQNCTITKDDIKPLLTVVVEVDNAAGGDQAPGDWTVTVSGSSVVPDSFAGSAGGVAVRLDANAPFAVAAANPSGGSYAEATSGACSGGGLSEGAAVTCTLSYTGTAAVPARGLLPAGFIALPLLAAAFRGRRPWTIRPS